MKGIQVRCYSGRTYADRPVSFTFENVIYKVERVEGEWQAPGARCFRVRTEGNRLFELCYNERQDEWSLSEPGGKE